MRVLRGCKIISMSFQDTYTGKGLLFHLFGFLLLVGNVPLVWTTDYTSLNATSQPPLELRFGDRLVSSPNHYFELGIFKYSDSYFLCIRYAPPIVQAVTWISERSTPLTGSAVLKFDHGNLKLHDSPNNIVRGITGTDDRDDVVSAELLDTGELVLKNRNGTEPPVWNSFDYFRHTDTLLPGQHMLRNQSHSLHSWQKTGNPAIANDTYAFGWDSRNVLTLSWTCSMCTLDWKGGPYIPAPDVYAAHTIQNVDDVYLHENLGHLYIGGDPPTAILSGGPKAVNGTTLRRITMDPDGGLRIWQYTINHTGPLDQTSNQISNQTWEPVANWVVSDRPDSRSQCTTIGTCGPFSVCFSDIDSLKPAECRCAGWENNATKGWFNPIDGINASKGCLPHNSGPTKCRNENGNSSGTIRPGMLELPGVDMPWGGDYDTLENLPANSSAYCKESCAGDCHCAGAVYSEAEHKCWKKNGNLYNLGYPTVVLHGTDRTSFLRNETVPEYKKPRKAKDNELVKILVPAVGISVLLVAGVIFYLWRNEKIQQWVPDCTSCCRRPETYVINYPGDVDAPSTVHRGEN